MPKVAEPAWGAAVACFGACAARVFTDTTPLFSTFSLLQARARSHSGSGPTADNKDAARRLLTFLTTALVKPADVEDAAAAIPADHWVPAATFAPAPHVALVPMIKLVAKFGLGKHAFPLPDPDVIKVVTGVIKAEPINGNRGASGQGVFYYRLNGGDVVKYSVSQQEEKGAPYLSVILRDPNDPSDKQVIDVQCDAISKDEDVVSFVRSDVIQNMAATINEGLIRARESFSPAPPPPKSEARKRGSSSDALSAKTSSPKKKSRPNPVGAALSRSAEASSPLRLLHQRGDGGGPEQSAARQPFGSTA